MLFTLILMTPLVIFACAALFIPDGQRAILAWLLMALMMVPVWWLLALPGVAFAQLFLSVGVNGWLLWRSQQEAGLG